jgi:hypothetical protein
MYRDLDVLLCTITSLCIHSRYETLYHISGMSVGMEFLIDIWGVYIAIELFIPN